MGFLDRLFGAPEPQRRPAAPARRPLGEDELAVERYRYLLRTAPPESIEAVHTEAFAKLTPEQRHLVYEGLVEQLPSGERVLSEEPSALARAATRAELRQPGTIERTIGSIPAPGAPGSGAAGVGGAPAGSGAYDPRAGAQYAGGPSFGSMFASSLLGSIAGYVVGSAIVSAFLPDPGAFDQAADGGAEGAAVDDQSIEAAGADASGDGGWGDFGGGDFGGGDFGDFGF